MFIPLDMVQAPQIPLIDGEIPTAEALLALRERAAREDTRP